MLKPSMRDILGENESYYEMVVAIAKKARKLADNARNSGEPLTEKPVSASVALFASGEEKLSSFDIKIRQNDD